jgi:hypothetical protein
MFSVPGIAGSVEDVVSITAKATPVYLPEDS